MSKRSVRLAPSFRNKVIMIFFAIIIVPFVLFAYFAHVKSIDGITNASTKISMSYLLQAKKNFEIYLNQINDQVNDLIGNKNLQKLLEKKPADSAEEEVFAVNLLALLYQNTTKFDAFQVHVYPMDPSSYPTYMSTIGESIQLGNDPWFRNAELSVSPTWRLSMPQQGRYGKPLLSYMKRFSGLYDHKLRGIIVMDLSEDQLKRFLSPTDLTSEQKLLLLNEEGVVLYDSSNNEWTGKPIPSSRFIDFMGSGREGSKSLDIEGQTHLVTFLKMDNEPWTIVSLTPLNQLTGAIDEIDRLLIFFLVIYLLCCIGVVIYLTISYTQPIVKLVRMMRKLEGGDFEFPYPYSSRKDEVGWLYRGFSSLIQKIEALIEETSRSERKKKELEFQVLSHQINPHFLYNTLESIRWKAENLGRSDISEMVFALGNLLRLSLNQGKEITTLAREIEHVKSYVLIEQARMGQEVRILYSFDEETLDHPFLRLLLQPIVENAIQHSIRDNFEKGKILIAACREGQDLVIEIADNGMGIPRPVLEGLENNAASAGEAAGERRGVGLRNVNDRLRLYFGEAYKLHIETGPELGTKITLRHPILEEETIQGGDGR